MGVHIHRQWPRAACFACAVAASAAWLGPPSRSVTAAESPSAIEPADPTLDRVHALQLRATEARLRVAELDLRRAVAANETFPNAIGDREIHRLKNHVALLRRQVEIARAHPRTAARQASIAAAEVACDEARADLDAAERANRRSAGSVSAMNMERLRAKLELADIRLELCRNPEYELSLLAELEWNVEQLTDEVIDLRHRIETGATED